MNFNYLAGLLDGDGSISIVDHGATRVPYLLVQLSQLDTPEIRALAKELKKPFWSTAKTAAGNPYGKIAWCGKDAERLLQKVGPHLRLKARQWNLVKRYLKAKAREDVALVLLLKTELQALNKET